MSIVSCENALVILRAAKCADTVGRESNFYSDPLHIVSGPIRPGPKINKKLWTQPNLTHFARFQLSQKRANENLYFTRMNNPVAKQAEK